MFSGKRLSVARKRRRLLAKELAAQAGVSPITVTRLELDQNDPDADTVERLAAVLDYPTSFFYLNDTPALTREVVSFRSLKAMSARERDAALSAGELGVEVYEWVRERFNLPTLDLPDLDPLLGPDAAAEALRQHWGLGYEPVSNLLKLLEAKGVKVLGLEEHTANVDAFSFWQDENAYVFLNSFKSAERSIFDAAHELGHLVLHKHGQDDESDPRLLELEANRFASAFLMPEDDLRAKMPSLITVDLIIRAKRRWRVSAMALAYRLRHLDQPMITEWQYRALCIELGKRGYRTSEPEGVDREVSIIWGKILTALWAERGGLHSIANDLSLPQSEVEMLLSGLLAQKEPPKPSAGRLRLV